MEHMARGIVADLLGEPMLKSNVGNGRQHTFATCCSGSEMPSVAIEIAESILKEAGVAHSFKQIYMCEIEPKKQKWGMEAVSNDEVCCFDDLTQLHLGKARCARHGGCSCVVRPADGLIVGVSCKDFARSSPNCWMQRGQALSGNSSPGKSADTFWGLMRLLDSEAGKTSWLMIENSDMLLEEDSSVDWGVMLEAIQARGFVVRALIANSVYFGAPMHRRRSYLLCLNLFGRHTRCNLVICMHGKQSFFECCRSAARSHHRCWMFCLPLIRKCWHTSRVGDTIVRWSYHDSYV